MGYYINGIGDKDAPTVGKAEFLVENGNARKIARPATIVSDLVCVVENGMFDAAAYIFSPEELIKFSRNDGRLKTWLIVPDAAALSGYQKRN